MNTTLIGLASVILGTPPRYRDAPRDSRPGDHGIAPAHLVGRGLRAGRGAATPHGRPLAFEANRGQADDEVKFLARGAGYTVFLTSTEAVSPLRRRPSRPPRRRPAEAGRRQPDRRIVGDGELPRRGELRRRVPGPGRSALRRTRGCDTSTSIPASISCTTAGPAGSSTISCRVRRRSRRIALAFDGADRVEVDAGGTSSSTPPPASFASRAPSSTRTIDGARRRVVGDYVLDAKGAFASGLEPTTARTPLVIDPVLAYSTYLGWQQRRNPTGRSGQRPGIAVDAAGNFYVDGHDDLADFPVTPGVVQGPHERSPGRLRDQGLADRRLIYSTYLGGPCDDMGTPSRSTARATSTSPAA